MLCSCCGCDCCVVDPDDTSKKSKTPPPTERTPINREKSTITSEDKSSKGRKVPKVDLQSPKTQAGIQAAMSFLGNLVQTPRSGRKRKSVRQDDAAP